MIDSFRGEYAFLSNFYSAGVMLDGMYFPTVEHAFQAAKTYDINARKSIAVARTPGEAKRMGKTVLLRDDWESVKCQVMLELLRQKFSKSLLKSKLLATGSEELVEGNNHKDSFWGVYRGQGKNMLGQLIMQVRKELSE